MINFTQYYQDFMSRGDPRVASWPMMDNPMKGVTLVVMYLGFVKVVGPAWMRNKKPYNPQGPMIIYNFFLVVTNTWIFINFGMLGWFTKYSWRCEPIDYSYNPEAIKMAETCWVFHISKFIEFADTIFFILRKKESQITSLHVFHHSLVPITTWFPTKFAAGGYNTIFAILNAFVHIWMYLYYGLAALGPSFQRYLWWKKYLTLLQLVQFAVVFVFMFQLTVFPTCEVSKSFLVLNVAQAVIFFVLFLNFFKGSYKRTKRLQKQKSEGAMSSESITNGYKENEHTENNVRHRKPAVSTMKYTDVDYVTKLGTISA